jgi:cytochrome c oxidase assembly protein subunit 15
MSSKRTNAYKPALALFTALGGAWVFVLVTLGAFTTSIGAGMAFTDWPLSNGSINPKGWLENLAMFAEHSHRLSATMMGLITIVMLVWIWRAEARPWLRQMAVWALIIVILQGVLGGTRVLLDRVAVPGFQMSLGQMLRIPHGVLAQIYVCLLIAIAVGCSKGWIQGRASLSNHVRRLGVICCTLLFIQLTIAATMRHNGAGLAIRGTFPFSEEGHLLPQYWDFRVAIHFAHRVMAMILAVMLPIFVFTVRRDRAATLPVRMAASAVLVFVVLQILLGMEIIRTFRQAGVTTSHVLVGALMLATVFWITWVAHRDRIEHKAATP